MRMSPASQFPDDDGPPHRGCRGGQSQGCEGPAGKLGVDMAAELISQIKEEHLCPGVHIMAIGAERNVPTILEKAGIEVEI